MFRPSALTYCNGGKRYPSFPTVPDRKSCAAAVKRYMEDRPEVPDPAAMGRK